VNDQPEYLAIRIVEPLDHCIPRSYKVWTHLETGTPSYRIYVAADAEAAIAQARAESQQALNFFSRI
jgi:hypothetical protein